MRAHRRGTPMSQYAFSIHEAFLRSLGSRVCTVNHYSDESKRQATVLPTKQKKYALRMNPASVQKLLVRHLGIRLHPAARSIDRNTSRSPAFQQGRERGNVLILCRGNESPQTRLATVRSTQPRKNELVDSRTYPRHYQRSGRFNHFFLVTIDTSYHPPKVSIKMPKTREAHIARSYSDYAIPL